MADATVIRANKTASLRADPAFVVAIVAIGVLALTVLVSGTRWVNVNTGDSNTLVAGARVAVHCVRDGTLRDCGGGVQIGSFGLLQYLPAMAMVIVGMGDAEIVRALAWLSTLSFGALVAVVAGPARRLLSPSASTVLVIVMISGPLVLYALLPYAEALGAALGVAFVVLACRRRSPALILALGPFAMVSKETAVPFLLVAGWVCARSRGDPARGWLPPRRVVAALVGAAAIALVAQALFNQFRYASFTNEGNTISYSRVPGLDLRARLAWALWGAPNVGVVWFWPAVTLVLAGLSVALVVQVRRRRPPATWMPSVAVLGLVALLTAGLASWFSTFGWVAWGPRLTLSVLPVLAVAALVAGGEELGAGVRVLARRPVALAGVAAVIALGALPQVGVIWNQSAIALPLRPTANCPELLPVSEAEPDYFYGCGLASAWDDDPYFLVEAARGRTAPKLIAQGAVVVALGALAMRLRREAIVDVAEARE